MPLALWAAKSHRRFTRTFLALGVLHMVSRLCTTVIILLPLERQLTLLLCCCRNQWAKLKKAYLEKGGNEIKDLLKGAPSSSDTPQAKGKGKGKGRKAKSSKKAEAAKLSAETVEISDDEPTLEISGDASKQDDVEMAADGGNKDEAETDQDKVKPDNKTSEPKGKPTNTTDKPAPNPPKTSTTAQAKKRGASTAPPASGCQSKKPRCSAATKEASAAIVEQRKLNPGNSLSDFLI